MTEEADKVLQAVYVQHRFDLTRGNERKTVRMLESLVRYNLFLKKVKERFSLFLK